MIEELFYCDCCQCKRKASEMDFNYYEDADVCLKCIKYIEKQEGKLPDDE